MGDGKAIDVLIIEDNPEDAELIVRALEKRRLANDVFIIEDGAEALDFIFRRGAHGDRPDGGGPKVIFLDIKLPKVSGHEVLKRLKSNSATKNIPVVVITSSREDPDIKAAYDLGANGYVVKPVEFESFLEAMEHTGYYWLLVNEPVR